MNSLANRIPHNPRPGTAIDAAQGQAPWAGALAAVLRPTAEASGLPNVAYTDDAFLGVERDRIFGPNWACVGFARDLPAPGDVRPFDLLGMPLLALRDDRGEIRVFHNVCSHRGMRLVAEPCRVQGALRCPYHSWAYGLDGRLRATPHIGGPGRNRAEGFDPAAHGLKPVRTALWLDMIFVNLSGDAPPFEDHVAPLVERWGLYDLERLRPGGADASLDIEVKSNWKLAVENYCESYHLPWVHPGLNSYSRLEDHYHIIEDGFAGQGSRVYAPAAAEGSPLPRFAGVPADLSRNAEYVALFPNLLLGIHIDHFFALWLEPLGPERTAEHLRLYFLEDGATDEACATARAATLEAWRTVFLEDVGVVEGMQLGRASPAFNGGCFSPVMDTPTHRFHRWVASRLLD